MIKKFYEVEVGFITRESDLIKVAASCQGQAEQMALEGARFDNPHGEEFEINAIEEITEK